MTATFVWLSALLRYRRRPAALRLLLRRRRLVPRLRQVLRMLRSQTQRQHRNRKSNKQLFSNRDLLEKIHWRLGLVISLACQMSQATLIASAQLECHDGFAMFEWEVDGRRFHIRNAEGETEYHAIEDIQKDAWGFSDLDIVPAATLIATEHSGGIGLGAFEGALMIGVAYGFAAWEHGRAC